MGLRARSAYRCRVTRSSSSAACFALLLVACGASPAPTEPTASGTGAAPEAKVHLEIRAHAEKDAKCEAGDICGFFLQVMSPGSDAKPLADKAQRILSGKCGGDIIVYKDARNVMGSGSVFATAEEKQSCEQALGRSTPDPDFPSYGVWRVK
jgi:hypothetical protein